MIHYHYVPFLLAVSLGGPLVWAESGESLSGTRSLQCKSSKCHQEKFFVAPLSDGDKKDMENVIWKSECPVQLEALRKVHVAHLTPDSEVKSGVLIVHESVASELEKIFREILDSGFVINQVDSATVRHGDDDKLMKDNITTAFNCRAVTGGKTFSKHSWGAAIDINPLWNPYVKGGVVLPPEGRIFTSDRSASKPGLLTPKSQVVTIFERYGWKWGGRWRSLKDWQHFEKEIEKSQK